MDKTNSKILTLSFVAFSALIGVTVSTLLKVFSGAFGPIAKAMNYDLFRHGLPVVIALSLFAYLQFNNDDCHTASVFHWWPYNFFNFSNNFISPS